MITAGVDLAAQPERTAVATIKWTAGRTVIENVVCRADDEDLLELVRPASKTGIDCPFGWPTAFVSFVTSHHAGNLRIPANRPSSRRNLTMRRTDLWAFGRRLREDGLLGYMGTVGDCYDNAMMESFWGTMRLELLKRRKWGSRNELANAIFEWIECWYNAKRRHSSIGMFSPVEFETRLRSPDYGA